MRAEEDRELFLAQAHELTRKRKCHQQQPVGNGFHVPHAETAGVAWNVHLNLNGQRPENDLAQKMEEPSPAEDDADNE